MKKLAVSICVALAAFAAGAQNVTVDAVNRPAAKVFAELMEQSGKNFVYSGSLLRGMRVTVKAVDRPIAEVLDMMFRDTDIRYKIRGNNVILSRREKPEPRRVTVNGFVREAGSGEALIGAIVTDSASRAVTVANNGGFFSMTLPEGTTALTVSYPGLEPFSTGRIKLHSPLTLNVEMGEPSHTLAEVVVTATKNRSLAMESSSVGAVNLSRDAIASTPTIFGESDIIKSLQHEPGVSAGVEGMAGMYVHGGDSDENLYMLDNIPLYQVNHFGGLFSAFNTEAIRNVDFYKSAFPAKYDGRLSSFMDVHTRDGSLESHHGSFRLGLTSGSFNLDGPIWKGHTSYSIAIRRSWYDLISIPILAIVNHDNPDEETRGRYSFMDLNLKVNHHFSPRSSAHIMFYYGDDYLKSGSSSDVNVNHDGWFDDSTTRLHWGNLVFSAGWKYVFSPSIFGEITGAYTRYGSSMYYKYYSGEHRDGEITSWSDERIDSDNNIHDWILRADFDWRPVPGHTVNFGAGYTRHSFLPGRSTRSVKTDDVIITATDSVWTYRADEANIYIGDDWRVDDRWRVNVGIHGSLFRINGTTHAALSPRAAMRYTINDRWAAKASYSRTSQYVYQLAQSVISLPTDQWMPILPGQKPQTADKIAAGLYYAPAERWTISLEGYYKWLHDIVEYRDEYYTITPGMGWAARMTEGRGSSRGLDFKIEKSVGKFTGHISYSLMWADRQFPQKNHGRRFPARFDNRHKINIALNWKISKKWEMGAAWTGMSGNRITLPTQCWEDPGLGPWDSDMIHATDLNNYRLPFYHRLDLSFTRHTKHGFWNFSIYNAYCHLNTISVYRDYDSNDYQWVTLPDGTAMLYSRPVFQKVGVIPIIPSISYTWLF